MRAKRKILGFPKPDLLVSTQNFQIFKLLTCLHVAYNTISLFLLLITDANVSIFYFKIYYIIYYIFPNIWTHFYARNTLFNMWDWLKGK